MADDITKLLFEIENRGAVEAEKAFRDISASLEDSINQYSKFNLEQTKTRKDLEKNVKGMRNSLKGLEDTIAHTTSTWSGMMTEGKMRRQEKRIQSMTKEMEKLSGVMTTGTAEQQQAAEKRMKSLQKAIDFEVQQTSRVMKKHQEEFQELVNMEKKSLADLTKDAMGGGVMGIQQLRQGDFQGAGQTLGGGVRGLGDQAKKKAFDMEMAAGAGGKAGGMAGMGKLVKTFAKVAGPIAMLAGTIGAIVSAFAALDSKITDVNKSMLENVSLAEMASGRFGDLEDKTLDAESALKQFRNMAMTDMDLRMLGLEEKEMGQILSTMHEQGQLLSDLRDEGVSYKDALETAQVAALNLGVDASETAGLIGTLADVTSESFDEAAASLTQIVSFAQDAGISTKKFFSTVQNVVGEMGLYNYRIEETAALLSKLTNIMDSKSAEEFTQQLSTSVKEMSALERSSLVVVNGIGEVAEMADRTQKRLQEALDPSAMRKAFEEIGAADLFNIEDIEGSVKKLNKGQRDMLQSAISDVDQATGEQFRKYRNVLETSRDSVTELQGILGDFAMGDQIKLQIGDLEKKLRMPLEDINSVLAESQGVSESQLRMFKALQSDLSGDLKRLQKAAAEDPESFEKLAKDMGYSIKLSEIQNGDIKDYKDLMSLMTKDKQEEVIEEQKKQKTMAEKSAELQRSMLDTLKYKLMDLVQGIYLSILDIYDAIMDMNVFGEDGPGERRRKRQEYMRKEFQAQQDIRDLRKQLKQAEGIEDEDRRKKVMDQIRGEIASKEAEVRHMGEARMFMKQGATEKEAQEMVIKGKRDVGAYKKQRAATRAAGMKAVGKEFEGATFKYQGKSQAVGAFLDPEKNVLEEIRTKEGKVLKGREARAAAKKAFEAGISKEAEANVDPAGLFGKDMKESLKEGSMSQKKMEEYTEKTKKALVDEGAKLDDQSLQTLAEKLVKEQRKEKRLEAFQEEFIKMRGGAETLPDKFRMQDEARDILKGGPGYIDQYVQGGGLTKSQAMKLKKIAGYDTKKKSPKEGKDVKMITGGVPFLDLQAGDIIVDQESLANTLTGGKGDFVPELIKGAGGGGGGIGGSNVMHANFNIYGGDSVQIRDTIMKVIQQWERKRSTS